VPACITGLTRLTLLDLSFNSLKSLKPGEYLKRLVAVNLRANLLNHFPLQLKVARHTAVELQLVRARGRGRGREVRFGLCSWGAGLGLGWVGW